MRAYCSRTMVRMVFIRLYRESKLEREDVDVHELEALAGQDDIVYSAYVLKTDGTVWAWGDNAYGQLGNGTTTDSAVPVQVG